MLAFGIGNPADWAIIFVIALILFGPKKLPELGQQLGQALREFRKIADDFTGATDSIRSEVASVGKVFRGPLNDVHATLTGSGAPLRQSAEAPTLVAEPEAVPAVSEPSGSPEGRGLRISTAVPNDGSTQHGDEKGRQ